MDFVKIIKLTAFPISYRQSPHIFSLLTMVGYSRTEATSATMWMVRRKTKATRGALIALFSDDVFLHQNKMFTRTSVVKKRNISFAVINLYSHKRKTLKP